jgi:hypothetical protein
VRNGLENRARGEILRVRFLYLPLSYKELLWLVNGGSVKSVVPVMAKNGIVVLLVEQRDN